jgi:predicted enzyme related to lactoylglutathione lyase
MGERDSYAPGTFCWADLGTTDGDAAKAFYTKVFGWEAVDAPAGDAGTYTTFQLEGRDVAALYEMGEEERSTLTPHWSSYVAVEDVDALAARVRDLGGEVLAEPFDVMQAGRMTAVRDPTGATLHLWQARDQIGAGRVNDPGCMVWNELATPDPARARDFYGELLGWTVEPEESGYGIVKRDGALNGGVRPVQEDEAPNWLVYFTAESADDTAAAIREAGGKVVVGPIESAVGRVVVAHDPQGARFAVFEGEVDP